MPKLGSRSIAGLLVLATFVSLGADWPRLRGPNGAGTAPEAKTPQFWEGQENIAWQTALPGPGGSSPIICGDLIFLTAYTGYGLDPDEPGTIEKLEHRLLCLARTDGKLLWDRAVKTAPSQAEYGRLLALHGYASNTPVTDGKAVYAFFGSSGVHAFSTSGEPLWNASVGNGTDQWGSAASPILYKDLLIVNASVESNSLVALDKATGKKLWQVEGVRRCWGTPLVVTSAAGRDELVVNYEGTVLGLNPATGEKLWECEGIKDYVCASVVADKDVVFLTAGRTTQTLAVRTGGQGDVSKTHVLWRVRDGSKVGTPLVHNGRLSWVDNRGVAFCLDAATGKTLYKQMIEFEGKGDKVYASVVLGGDKLYVVSREGGVAVLEEGPEFRQLAHNKLDPSVANASPAIAGNQLLLRTDKFLYCIGK